MKVFSTHIPDVLLIEPTVYTDERGYFFEAFNEREFTEKVLNTVFVQDNESCSSYGVIRGLHFQRPPYTQAKLVRVVSGTVWDVAVDLREGSPTFGQYVGVELSSDNKRQLFIPRGFAHGFSVLSEEAIFQYKCDNYYVPQAEGSIAWNDTTLNIDWKIPEEHAIISAKDTQSPSLADAPFLFQYTQNPYENTCNR